MKKVTVTLLRDREKSYGKMNNNLVFFSPKVEDNKKKVMATLSSHTSRKDNMNLIQWTTNG